MPQTVSQLKDLLFDEEKAALNELQRRIESVATASKQDQRSLLEELEKRAVAELADRAEIAKRLDEVFGRAGTEERFRDSVAIVLDGALRTAEVERHAELSAAVAPLVVRTIKTEITNSQDELVEALYPMTGRMVKSYVASAIKDMMDQINKRFESKAALRMRSAASGRSAAEIALAETQRLVVEEIYLIRRGTGELLERWPEEVHGQNRDQAMSGVLTAINEFASEAFSTQGSALREIDLGDSRVFLRASPTFLLAAKCAGSAPASVEQIVDEEVLNAIERYDHASDDVDENLAHAVLPELSSTMQARINAKQDELTTVAPPAGTSPAKKILILLGILLAGWMAWTLYESYLSGKARSIATQIVNSTQDIRGYPTRIAVAPYGSEVVIAGLTPSPEAKSNLLDRLRQALSGSQVRDELTVVASALDVTAPKIARLERNIAEVRAEGEREIADVAAKADRELGELRTRLDRETVARATDRAKRRLTGVAPIFAQLSSLISSSDGKARVASAQSHVGDAIAGLGELQARVDPDAQSPGSLQELSGPIDALTATIAKAYDELSAIMAAPQSAGSVSASQPASVVDAAEDLAIATERVATLALAATQAAAVKPAPFEPTIRQRLEEFARTKAVFFSTGTDYRNDSQIAADLSELAKLAKQSELLIRIIGYTDDRGASAQNTPLSQSRADKVFADLIALGVPASQLVAIGRTDAIDLSPFVGEDSPNRRVQFEIGFDGERPRAQR